ncbi:histidine kinase dimerization/phosphoacceptor domain -containing protein [Hymenobacter guriensis]|nr:histidine kinase dimerization/phosphoacceptor domain -containing protein [Hymenobacter guriensis]
MKDFTLTTVFSPYALLLTSCFLIPLSLIAQPSHSDTGDLIEHGLSYESTPSPPVTSIRNAQHVQQLNKTAMLMVNNRGLAAGRQHAGIALQYARKVKDIPGELDALRLSGLLASEDGDLGAAMQYYTVGLKKARNYSYTQDYWSFYNSMGATATDMGNHKYAGKLLHEALQSYKRYPPLSKDSAVVAASICSNLATCYSRLGNHGKALAYGRRAIATLAPVQYRASVTKLVAGLLEMKSVHYAARDSAQRRLQAATAIHHRQNNVLGEAHTLLDLADFNFKLGNLATANRLALETNELARRIKSVGIQRSALQLLSQITVAKGNFRDAVMYRDQLAALNSTIFTIETARSLGQQRASLEARQREHDRMRIQKLTQANLENRKLSNTQRYWMMIMLGSLLVAIICIVIVTLYYRKLKERNTSLSLANEEIQRQAEENQRQADENHRQAEENQRQAAEKQVLLQELHHRVKNNLQIISTLLSWQQEVEPELASALEASQARILSMALVHEQLYATDNLAEVQLDAYLTKLLDTLHTSYNSTQKPIIITKTLAPLIMTVKEAIPFGLLVNELVTNSYKHAFAGRASGRVHVELSGQGASFQLLVADDGLGLHNSNKVPTASLGTQLIASLAKQLKAILEVESDCHTGTRCTLARA